MIHGEVVSVRVQVAALLLVSVLAIASGGFVTSVSAQSVDEIQTTLTDESGDGLDDRVEVSVTVSEVESGQTTVELGEEDFDVDVSPTDTADGNQEQFVSALDSDGDGTNEGVEFTGVGTASATYTVVADLSGQADGDTGNVEVNLTGGTTDSASFSVGGRDGGNGEDTDGSDQADGDSDSDGTDSNGQTDGDADSDETDGDGGSGSGSGSGGEGMPGFTPLLALLALVLSAAYHDRG